MMMTRVRRTVTAVTAGAAGLALTACSAGITTASQSPSVGRTASTSAASTPGTSTSTPPSPSSSASPVDTIIIDSPLRTFPIPSGAQVIGNITCEKETIIELGAVTVAKVSSFYNSVLPQDGYKITGNSMIDTPGDGLSGPAAEIQFTGHGYKGTISALSNFGSLMASAGGSTSGVPSDMTGNFITIDLIPPGAAGCPTKGP
jgi:hypothetical protein